MTPPANGQENAKKALGVANYRARKTGLSKTDDARRMMCCYRLLALVWGIIH
jgi:hypothetical protein